MLEFGRGLEDFTIGGFLGVLNNIPGVFRSIGQVAKLSAPQVALLETVVSITATGAYAAYKNWGSLKALWDDGTGPKAIPDLKELNRQLDELKNKPVKSLIDQIAIDVLDHAVAKMERLQAAGKAQEALPKAMKKGCLSRFSGMGSGFPVRSDGGSVLLH